jgi:hypothetical protein
MSCDGRRSVYFVGSINSAVLAVVSAVAVVGKRRHSSGWDPTMDQADA